MGVGIYNDRETSVHLDVIVVVQGLGLGSHLDGPWPGRAGQKSQDLGNGVFGFPNGYF